MPRKIEWDRQIGRRLKLRDLHVFLTAAQCGSMARAANLLGVSQPTISAAMAYLENTFGVKLLDRSPRGVEPTIFGQALMKRSVAAFDELKQSSLDIAFLADPGHGELRVEFQESLSPAFVAPVIRLFAKLYPRVTVQMDNVPSAALQFSELRARRYDFTLALLGKASFDEEDLSADVLFHDQLAIATSVHSRWARKRKINLAELANEPWVLAPPDTWNSSHLAEAFQEIGLGMPRATLITMSEPLRTLALLDSNYISAFARSALRVNALRFGLKILPVDLPINPWPIALLRLKNRTLSPVAERFIACARQVGKDIVAEKQRFKN